MFSMILRKTENLFLQLWPNMFSNNQIAVFFDHQFFWNESISLLDILHSNNP